MKTFLDHLKEEVTPTALSDGSVDIEKDSVRQEINGILSGISSCPRVTPYTALTKIRKALAYFHIYLPKRAYMEGKHGVEVWEIHQFGQKMGMTDQGEFINETPTKFYLFFHYHLVGAMFMVSAKVVDKQELDRELDFAEAMIKEDASAQQNRAKAIAPKEDQHTALGDCDCSQGDSPSTKKAVDVSMRKKGIDEGRMPASVIKHKQRIANMTPEEKAKKFAGKSDEQLKGMARRHGFGKDSTEYSKHGSEKKLDEVSLGKLVNYMAKSGRQQDNIERPYGFKRKENWRPADKEKYERREQGRKLAHKKMKGKAKVNASAPKHPYMEETISEKAPAGAKFERMVKHIKKGYSKDGLTAKEKSIAYATAWKAKKHQKEETKFDPSTEIPRNS